MGTARLFGGLVLLMMLATSCLKVEAEIVIDDDGSGDIEMLTALDSESVFVALAEQFGEGFAESGLGGEADFCDDFTDDLMSDTSDFPAGAAVELYAEDSFCGARINFALEAATDHSAAIAALFEDDTAATKLYKNGENWIFETALDTSELDEDAGDLPQAMVDGLLGDASIRYVVDLPGNAIDGENNATDVDGGRFTWEIDLTNPPDRLFAQTAPGGGGGGNLGMIIGLLAVFGIVAGLAWWFLTQRSRSNGLATAPSTGTGMDRTDLTDRTDRGSGLQTPPVAESGAVASPPPLAGSDPVANPSSGTSTPDASSSGTNTPGMSAPGIVGSDARATLGDPSPGTGHPIGEQPQETATASTEPAAQASPEPVFDQALNAWVLDDPVRGRLVHDTASNTWKPA